MEEKKQKSKLFEYLDDISRFKKDIMEDENDKEYSPFVINKFLADDITTLMYAQEMNIHYDLPKRLQYDYYLHAIKKNRRFFRWKKKEKLDDISSVKEFYGYSTSKAREVLPLHSRADLDYIKKKLDKGGFRNEKRSKNAD